MFRIKERKHTSASGAKRAGKTVIMKSIMGIISFEGSIDILGLDPAKHGKVIGAKVGYLPQQNSLYVNMSVMKNMKH